MHARLSYSLFMFLGLAAFLAVRHFVPKPPALQAVPWWKRLSLGLAAFVGGTFGAKLPFVGGEGGWFALESWVSDGKTVTMGLIGAYVAVELMKLALDIRVKTGDTFALPLAVAMAIGRWGCFFNGCCYGVPTTLPWGVDFLVDGQTVRCHPTQVYESIFHLTMAVVLVFIMRLDLMRNQRLKFYLIAYGGYRFLTEFIRPEKPEYLGLTFYQWVALGMIAALSLQWWWDARRQDANSSPSGQSLLVGGPQL
ncbi:MAG TPA: prolipoprotein diacylglyceryl transferase family protein [Gemmataceae bacterium]|nr:prolipoprotein diacylglyceryl transferase family protein [Gemmataceae bacterium]